MDQLWAPWRLAYVATAKPPAAGDPCFICHALTQTEDRENLVVLRNPASVVVLNRYPYNNGHLLIAPRAHKANLAELTEDEMLETMNTLRRMVGILGEGLHPDGFNIGLNLGKSAGAGLPGHLHWHVVPRWDGDTNFMPVVADVKVIAQSLDSLYGYLVERLKSDKVTS
jgi:ATP adenylyltransferase